MKITLGGQINTIFPELNWRLSSLSPPLLPFHSPFLLPPSNFVKTERSSTSLWSHSFTVDGYSEERNAEAGGSGTVRGTGLSEEGRERRPEHSIVMDSSTLRSGVEPQSGLL